jgi:transposase
MAKKKDARSLSLVAKEDLRRRVVQSVVDYGVSKAATARVCGVSRTSVHTWVALFEKSGDRGLTPKRPGRPRGDGRLKSYQAATIVNIIKDRCPDQLKLPFALWTREAVRDLIESRCGVHYSLSMVGNLLRRWGFTAQRPVTRAYERDDGAIRHWLRYKYPALRRRAKREKAEIYWEDETGLRSDHLAGRSYSPRGETPVIRNTGKRFGCNIASAVNNLGKMRFMVFKGSFTQTTMIDFLRRLVTDAKRKVIVITDGHPAHKGRRVRQWLKERAARCELVLLPAYAPELNPDELLNQDLKSNVFSMGRPRTREELISQTRSYLRATQKRPDIVRAYFQESHVNYAAHRR